MITLKCKCGRFTNNGLLCTNCQKDMSIDTLSYEPESVIDDEVDDDKFEELNFFVMHDYEDYNED